MDNNSSRINDLVKRLNEGDEAAFEELYYLYSSRLLGFLTKLVKSDNFAAEIVQDTFIKIWNNHLKIDPNKSFHSYMFRIAENLVYDFFRKAARDKKLEKVLINHACNDYQHVEEKINKEEINLLLRKAIDTLPPRRREIFQLVKMEERSYEEVSKLLHISTSTINDHVVKATKAIREKLERFHLTAISILVFLLCQHPL